MEEPQARIHYLQLPLEILFVCRQGFIVHKRVLLSELICAELATEVLKSGISAFTAVPWYGSVVMLRMRK